MSGLEELAAALPKCAVQCLQTAIQGSSCAATNQTCICSNEELNTVSKACTIANCTVREALFTQNLTSVSCGIAPRVDLSYIPITTSFLALAGLAVSLRIVARLQAKLPIWWDDFFVVISFFSCVALCALPAALGAHGLGTDIWAVPFSDITEILKGVFAVYLLFIASRSLVRLSILLFLHRIFGHIKLARQLFQISFVIVSASAVAFLLTFACGCTPTSYWWTQWDGAHEGYCINTNITIWACTIIALAFDVWILVIPLPFIVRLHLPMRKKVLSAVMFGLGIVVVIISGLMIQSIDTFTLSSNPTADFVPLATWGGLEVYVAIICACLPNFHTLWKALYARLKISREYLHSSDVELGANTKITATTTVFIEQHPADSEEFQLHQGSHTGGAVGIELGARNNGTSGFAWS
ncbi:hypothetical protein GGR56DRAFT_665046 [Xylariaceae sp. FL0804]|nr:hypothetical protein GGR56DRAFT_665046 [Xylariaceae sp. FL0804]